MTILLSILLLTLVILILPGSAFASEMANGFTISLWVNPTTSIATKALAVKDTEVRLVTDASGNPLCQIYAGGAWQIASNATSQLPLNTWSHVTCTYDKTNLKVFVNGTQTGSVAQTNTVNDSATALLVGQDDGGTYGNLTGTTDDLRIYNRALSPKEVRDLYNFAPGPVGYWKMDEGSWTVDCSTASVIDSSGNGNNGKACPNSTGPRGGAVGKYGKAGSFDGSDDYVTITNSSSLSFGTGNATMSFWVKPNAPGTEAILGNLNSSNDFALNIINGIPAGYFGSTTLSINNGQVLVAKRWYYLSIVRDGDNGYIYVNGIRDGSTATGLSARNLTAGDYGFGKQLIGGAFYFTGQLDDVKIYNYARTQKQIVEDMNARDQGSVTGSAVSSKTPVGYYKFDEGQGATANNSGSKGSTINGSLGTGTSAPAWTNSGKYGKALQFDGTADWVSFPDMGY